MDLPKLAACSIIPSRFTNMLIVYPGKKSSFLKIRTKVSNDDIRTTCDRSAINFEPSIWHYDHIQALSGEYKEEMYVEQNQVLREEVRMMLSKVEDHLDQLDLIDVLQRLGVAYHFKNEIKNILDNIYNIDNSKKKKNLHAAALEFRLLRQHSYDVSLSDVFVSFQNETISFNKCQSNIDVDGMLSLYEASFLSLEEETILDELRNFSEKILKEYSSQNIEGNYISLLVDHALELPLHWRTPRWEAQWFIHAYERRQNLIPTLLQLAKLDFNIVQTTYQEELKYASRWWKRIGLVDHLSFIRDRLVEGYFWTMETNFEPNLEFFRKIVTKVNCLIVTIDDIYDSYGTLEELELFTEVIVRWDLKIIDNLPDYMKICFLAVYNFINEFAFDFLKMKGHYITPYLKKAWVDLCKSYLIEAKWHHGGYMPSCEEYMENAWKSIGITVVLIHAYFAIPHSFKKEDLIYLEECCDLIRFSSTISRLINDLGTHKRESEMGDVLKFIQCYMNETGAYEADAQEHIESMLCSTWKQMNKEAHSSSLPQSFIETVVNVTRMSMCMYYQGDGYTSQDPQIKSRILSLIVQPTPIVCREN